MSFIVTNEGEEKLLEWMLGVDTSVGNFKLHLYTTDLILTKDLTVATMNLMEMTEGGYVEKTLNGPSWTVTTGAAECGGGDVTSGEAPGQTFNFSGGPYNIYGYYITDFGENVTLWIERFNDAPIIVEEDGSLVITAKIIGD